MCPQKFKVNCNLQVLWGVEDDVATAAFAKWKICSKLLSIISCWVQTRLLLMLGCIKCMRCGCCCWWSQYLSDCHVGGLCKTAEQINVLFGMETPGDLKEHWVRWGSPSLTAKGRGFDAVIAKLLWPLVVVILSADELQQLIGTVLPSPMDYVLWQPSWVARYSVLIKCRGVIKSKGYVMRATRDIKQRPYLPATNCSFISSPSTTK